MGNVCVVTKGRTILVITVTQISSGFKKSAYSHLIKYMYHHVKIASLANVKSCVTVGPIHSSQMFGPVYIVSVDFLSGLAL